MKHAKIWSICSGKAYTVSTLCKGNLGQWIVSFHIWSMHLSIDMPSTVLTKSLFILGNLEILTQPTVLGLMKDHFTGLHKWTSINSPVFGYFILLIIFTDYLPNHIVIFPPQVQKGLNS